MMVQLIARSSCRALQSHLLYSAKVLMFVSVYSTVRLQKRLRLLLIFSKLHTFGKMIAAKLCNLDTKKPRGLNMCIQGMITSSADC